MNNLPLFMKKNKLLYDTRKTYHKVRKILNKNSIKGRGSLLFYYRLLKIRKLIIKWYIRNDYNLIMIGLKKLDYTLNHGLKNDMSDRSERNISHIFSLTNDFMKLCGEIEDYYG